MALMVFFLSLRSHEGFKAYILSICIPQTHRAASNCFTYRHIKPLIKQDNCCLTNFPNSTVYYSNITKF